LPGAIHFKGGTYRTQRNISTKKMQYDSLRPALYQKKYYVLLQFDQLPDQQRRKELSAMGVRLFDYIPDHSFLAELHDSLSIDQLKKYSVSGVFPMPSKFKTEKKLLQDPEEDLHDPNKLIAVRYFGSGIESEVAKGLEQAGAALVPTRLRPDHVLFVRAGSAAILSKIASLPYVSYISSQSMKPRPLNYNNRAAHGIDVLGAPSERNLQGDGVVVGIGDNADPYTHVDFTGRLIERFNFPVDFHGTHTSGIVGGGGIKDPQYKGMAPHSTLIPQLFSDILVNSPTYVGDYDMVLTNNSYSNYNSGCQNEGEYDVLAAYADAQLVNYPNLLHVFAAGNDGGLTCSPYPNYQYGTVTSGFQCAKNVLTVGNMSNFDYTIYYSSSSGPVKDGRLKPEIVAGGAAIVSTIPNNAYTYYWGTSVACPTVTGGLALMVQRYRQLHGGADPSGALLKALVCNTATDFGNPGPDYLFGYGSLNARAAVEAMENNQYYLGSVNNGSKQTYTLSGIPPGLRQVRILLYWPDLPAAPNAASTLVNNLDLTVSSPDAVLHHPLILNPDPAHVQDVAVEGIDNLNNIEQVVINNPPGGTFTITVNGTAVPGGSQNFVVAYQTIQPSVTLEYPYGNDTWVPGNPEIIRWNAYGGEPNTFTLDYSTDNGGTWTTIDNAIPSTTHLYGWTTPAISTNQGRIRVTRNSTGYSDMSHYPITILGQPTLLTTTNPCPGYVHLTWNTIPSATSYDILQLKGDSMQKVASTTDTFFLAANLNRDSSYWFSVGAVNGSSPGRRSIAANIQPAGGSCTLTSLDNDYTIDSLIAPLPGRMHTSSELGNATPIKVELKNLGTIPTGASFALNYQVNGAMPVTEAVSFSVPPNGGVYTYSFATPYDFSAAGSYILRVWVTYPLDPQTGNDTLTTMIKQLSNDPLTLSPSFTEGFESAVAATYTSPTSGFAGLDRCDLFTSNSNGRASTFINTGFARTGARCVTLDQIHSSTISTADSLLTTFNLSNYTPTDQIWLDFFYKNQGNDFSLDGNQVWIRGDDQAAWVPAYILDTSAAKIGVYQPSTHIDVTGILKNASPSQTISSSFQVKFGEQGYTSATSVIPDGNLDDGYSFDDLKISRAIDDIGITGMTAPDISNICALGNAETISLKIKNYSSSPVSNIPVTFSVNGVAAATETVPSINAFDSVVYTFSQKADLSSFQAYSLTAWVHFAGDDYSGNDTLAPVQFQTGPLISSFPYLEGFESGSGYWSTGGINSSWQLGAPKKTIINKAANGAQCWVTSLTGNYNDNETSYLTSPCFDLSGLSHPVLSFSHIFQTEDDCDCDYHWVEYTTDGVNWTKLGAVGSGTNWYDNASRQAWQLSAQKWQVSSYDIPVTAGRVKFRIVLKSDPGVNYEGVGIDDVHIFDKAAIYSGASITGGLSQPVSGNGWIDFNVGGQRVASINPNGQDLGMTNVNVFINNGPVRNDGKQYYLNRNLVIRPANAPAGNVGIRYYFLDTESKDLLNASGCGACSTLQDAYQSNIMQFSSPVAAAEDSLLGNDTSGTFHYFLSQKGAVTVPYDNGYYTEYKVGGFSEFWVNTRPATDLALTTLVAPGLSGICNLSNAEPVRVKVKNYSTYDLTNIPVSYSVNGVTVTENIPALAASDSVIYRFTQTADLSAYGAYTLSAWVSYSGDNDPADDSLTNIRFQTSPVISAFPYLEGFENNNGYWHSDGSNSSWQWGAPAKTIINRAANGTHAWVTSLAGNYNNNELSYLYSPCFDLSGLSNPVLSFSHIFRMQDDCDCDDHWVEYSTDGLNWTKLGAAGNGTNWYDNSSAQAWKTSDFLWHVSSYDIPVRAPATRFRIVMKSDGAITDEGVGIDDVHIFDKVPIYTGPTVSSGLTRAVSGNNWINFDLGGQRVASINPNGQDLGNTNVDVFVNTGVPRNDGKQYYLNRNLVIQPSNAPTAPVSVRYYFPDTEVQNLLQAMGCSGCAVLIDAYQAGVAQYSSPLLTEENGSLSDDLTDTFHFLLPHRDVNIIPYDNGYYAAYQVNGFSEFWINSGSLGQNQPSNLVLLSFTAAKTGSDALLQWSTIQEAGTSRFVIEKSRDGTGFFAIDSIKATGNNNIVDYYGYTDKNSWSGANYYRLKIVGANDAFNYSPTLVVNDSSGGLLVSLYPNPVERDGRLYISSSSNCRRVLLTDATGRTAFSANIHGFFNTLPMSGLAKGIYFVRVDTDEGTKLSTVFVK
jgi:hypothetical protein